jgi:hypothetical protein
VSYGIPLAILFAAISFSRSAPFWGWHLLHGFHAETNGLRIWVPLSYRAIQYDDRHGITLVAYRGLFPTPHDDVNAGTMMIDFVESNQPHVPLEIGFGVGAFALNIEGPFHKKSEQEISMAGRNGSCVEYAGDAASGSAGFVDQDIIKVNCWFGDDLRASFIGDPSGKQKFFEMIESARQEKGKL